MKYIDAERLQKEVKRLERAAHKSALDCADSETRKFHEGKALAYQFVGILIDSLQQEQPEVDLEKEIEEHVIYMPHGEFASDNERQEDVEWARKEFRYFYKLGFNAKK